MLYINKKKTCPFVSIITPTFNSEKYLEETLKSLSKQKFKNFEIIIIDNLSTDKTLQIVKKFKHIVNYCKSSRDKGIYDAFNKGMKIARGKYIGIVNSDDILLPNALMYLKKYDVNNPSIDFFFGSVKKHWAILHGYNPEKIFYSWGFYTSHSTGFFIKKESLKKIGIYNVKYKFHADYDFFYRMIVKYKMKGMASKKNELFGIFRRGGFSSKVSLRKKLLEELKIRLDNGQNFFLVFIIGLYRVTKHFKKIFLNN
jgi:glycosyltransferase involved in cell wall biosynthesis